MTSTLDFKITYSYGGTEFLRTSFTYQLADRLLFCASYLKQFITDITIIFNGVYEIYNKHYIAELNSILEHGVKQYKKLCLFLNDLEFIKI